MTRIKYHKSGKNYTSNYLLNYEGKRFIIFIHKTIGSHEYYMSIVDEKGNALENTVCDTSVIAKKQARSLLINKYNVRLNEEIRPRS